MGPHPSAADGQASGLCPQKEGQVPVAVLKAVRCSECLCPSPMIMSVMRRLIGPSISKAGSMSEEWSVIGKGGDDGKVIYNKTGIT